MASGFLKTQEKKVICVCVLFVKEPLIAVHLYFRTASAPTAAHTWREVANGDGNGIILLTAWANYGIITLSVRDAALTNRTEYLTDSNVL